MNLDLNLLNIFDTLYEMRSVTKSAARLNLTQSAVSHALKRLREAVGDPLFVRATGGLQPTTRAVDMAPTIRTSLAQLRTALAPTAFDPAVSTRTFTIAAGSYFCSLLIPELIAKGRTSAPGISLRILPIETGLLAELDEGVVDLTLGAFSKVPARLKAQSLFCEEMVWVAAADNPIAYAPVELDRLIAQPRLAIGAVRAFEPAKALFADGGLEATRVVETGRTITPQPEGDERAIVYDTLTALAVVERTDMIALVPRRVAAMNTITRGIVILDAPGENQTIELVMLWPERSERDAGLGWLRDQILEIIE